MQPPHAPAGTAQPQLKWSAAQLPLPVGADLRVITPLSRKFDAFRLLPADR
jgi:hypothetical protein